MNSWQPRQAAPGHRSGSPLLAVNFLAVTYTVDKFPADVIPFESPEQFRELRAKLAATHAVTRAGDRIVCVPISAEAPSVGKRTELDVRKDRRITAHLVEEALARDVLSRWYKFRSLRRLNMIKQGWANYFRHAVAQKTFDMLDNFTWWRLIRMLCQRHHWRWKDVRRRFTTPTGRWLPITADEIELKPIAATPITRYRYRGSKILNPWVHQAA